MYRYTRRITIKNGASMPPALRAGVEIATYLNKTYGLQMKVGAEVFGGLKICWFNDMDSLDALSQLNAKLMPDKVYWELLEKIKPFVLEGSVQDNVVQLFG